MPKSVALVGASDRPGSLGRSVFENLRGGAFKGEIYAVNPRHRRVSGQRSYASVSAIGKPIDLVVITATAAAVPGLLGAMTAPVRAAVVMSTPDATDVAGARAWRRDVSAAAKKRNIRVVGPGAFGIIRADMGLNATFGTTPTLRRPPRAGVPVRRGMHGHARLCRAHAHRLLVGALAGRRRRRELRRTARRARAGCRDRRHPPLRRVGRRRTRIHVCVARRGAHQAGRGAEGGPVARGDA